MIRAMVWKEWGENRWKYGAMWAIFNAPILLISFALAVSRAARTPFADLSDGTVMKYLPLSLGESFLIASVMLVVTALVGVASFRTELDSGSLYFLFDLPVPRKRYIGLKVGNGVVHVALAVTFAILFAPLVDYGLILLTGKVTVAGSSAAFAAVFGAALRSVPWCVLVSVVAFCAAALIASVTPRWWMAATLSLVLVWFLMSFVLSDSRFAGGGDFFNWFPPNGPEGTMSVSANLGTPWLNVTNVFPMPTAFAPWKWLPMTTAVGCILVLSLAMAMVYERKEEA